MMSAIKKMNSELREILGRDPTIHEQVDILMLSVIKERLHELQLAYQMNPDENYKEAYLHAMKCVGMIQDRNPEIFTYNDDQSDNPGDKK